MNSVDDTKENIDEVNQEELDDSEEVVTSDELEQKKRITNEFNVDGNKAYTQIFIQNLGAFNANKGTEAVKSRTSVNKKYDLRNQDDCTEFIEEFKVGEYLAIAIILSTFEAVVLGDIPDLTDSLMKYLPVSEEIDSEGEILHNTLRNPYLSLNTILSVIGGQRFVTEDGQQCICLGENSKQALINILEQFPVLRSSIVSWLIYLSGIYKYRTFFDIYQIATAFTRIVSFDFFDAKRRIFPQLYSNPNNTGLLGLLMYKLYQDIALKEEVFKIILYWIKSDSEWIWKSACLSYSYFTENENSFVYEAELIKAIGKKIIYFKSSEFSFIAMLLSQSKSFRTMISEVFYEVYEKSDTRKKKEALAQNYVKLIRFSYYRINASFMDLPLAACDTKKQQENLFQIIEKTMSVYRLRRQLYAILKAYLKEISYYDFSQKLINHISAYFYNLGSGDIVYQQDILEFLKNCHNEAAEQIYNRLHSTYDKKGEYTHE